VSRVIQRADLGTICLEIMFVEIRYCIEQCRGLPREADRVTTLLHKLHSLS
jgi:hypothetical protein